MTLSRTVALRPQVAVRACWVFLLVLVLSLTATSAASQEEFPEWTPPLTSKWDWVHLTSGEWLKGELKSLRERKLIFDSDNLDDVEIDWADVAALYVGTPHLFRLESGENIQGTAQLRDGVFHLQSVSGAREIPRSEIFGIVPGDGTELDYWSGYVGISATLQDGNTDQTDLSGNVGFARETGTLRWRNGYRGVYSKINGTKNTENHRANTVLDVFVTSRLFLTLPAVEYYRDEFQNIEHRATPYVAIGYEFLRNELAEFDLSAGPGFQYTAFDEVTDGDDDSSSDFTAVLKTTLNLDLPRGIELDSLYKLNIVATNTDATSHHFETVLSADIWGPLELDLTFIFDRIEKPESQPDEPPVGATNRPDRNDFSLMLGLSIDF